MSHEAKVLIVDDEPRMCDSLKVLLGNEGYQIQTRHSGQEALEALVEDVFDLVLLDLVLPDMNSGEIMDHITSQTPGTPIIVITGHASLDSAIGSLKKGVFDYLEKPFDHQQLSRAVKNALDQKALKSERDRVKMALQESERKYKTLVENSLTGIFIHQDGKYVFVNDRFAEMHGYKPEELLGKEYLALVHPDERGAFAQKASAGLKGEAVTERYEVRRLKKDGTSIACEMMATRIEYGGHPAIMGNIIDITERKRAQEAVKESEEKHRTRFEEAVDAIFVADAGTGILTDCNYAASRLVGRAKSEIVGRHQQILHPPEEVAGEFSRTFKAHLENKEGQALETKVITSNGEIRDVSIKANIFELKGKKFLQGIFRDITERKRIEKALVRAKEDWENTFDAITDIVMLLDNQHRIVRVNRAGAQALNTTKEALVGKKCYEAVHGERRRVGECPLALTIKTFKPQTKEITEPKLGGTFICSTSPILDDKGKLTGYTHTLKNITESKRLEAQFQQAQKMEAIGTLAGGIAHDFNNLLMGIQGNVSLMQLHMDSTHAYYGRLGTIEKQVQSGARLTSQLLGYARQGKYEVKPVDLNHLVRETSDSFGRTRKDITVHRELAGDLFAIEADQGQIDQVLLNLFVNASDAMPGGGDLTLKTANVTDKEMRGKPYEPKPGNYVLLTVTDTGTGMDKETMGRIFDPFFTTKEMGRGTGLGLASSYGIIKSHGGYIDADSSKGHGATFSIYLPASEKRVQKAIDTAEKITRETGMVLLVDDEDVILEVGRDLLQAMGYRVLTARDGREAIDVYRKNQRDVDIVALDMVMPNMGGGEAYDRLKELNPDVKVLLISGYNIDGEATEILQRGCDGFVQKPFTMKQLSGKIMEILGKK